MSFVSFELCQLWWLSWFIWTKITSNKKVLLRERKRHTARRVAIVSPCYSEGGGGPSTKIFFSSLNMYQAKSGVKNFSLYGWGGGVPWQKKFFPVWTCIKPNLVSKFFPFTVGGGGGSLDKKFFFPVWTCIKPNLVSKFFPFTVGGVSLDQKIFFPVWTCIKPNPVSKIFPFTSVGGGGGVVPQQKNFFPVWTCIKQNLVSKFFPFTGGRGGPSTKTFFSSLNMYQAKSGVKFFSLCWGGGVPWQNFFFPSLNMYQAKSGVKIFSFYCWGGGVPQPKNFFPSLNMYQAKSGVKNFSLYRWGGGVPRQNFFLPVWTCIKPNLVSKFFPFTGGGGRGGVPRQKHFFSSLNMYQAKSGVKNFSLYWDRVPPPPQVWIDTQSENITSRHPSDAGGNDDIYDSAASTTCTSSGLIMCLLYTKSWRLLFSCVSLALFLLHVSHKRLLWRYLMLRNIAWHLKRHVPSLRSMYDHTKWIFEKFCGS